MEQVDLFRMLKQFQKAAKIFIVLAMALSMISASAFAPIKLEPVTEGTNESSEDKAIKLDPIAGPDEDKIENITLENISVITTEKLFDIREIYPKLSLDSRNISVKIDIRPTELFEEIKTNIDINSSEYDIILEDNQTTNTKIDIPNKAVYSIGGNVTNISLKVVPQITFNSNITVTPYNKTIIIDRINRTELFRKASKEWNMSINISEKGVEIKDNNSIINISSLEDLDKLSTIKSYTSNKTITEENNNTKESLTSATPIVSAELGNTSAEISLRKLSEVDKIIRCEDWSYLKEECNSGWEDTNITFADNSTHIKFNVSHFSAYQGATQSSLWIWDQTDTTGWFDDGHIKYPDDNITFYANYTRNNGNRIAQGQGNCYIKFNESGSWGTYEQMPTYDGMSGRRSYIRNFTDVGTYTYNVTCNGTFDTIELQDTVEVTYKGISTRQYKDIVYNNSIDKFNITLTVENRAGFEDTIYVYDILDPNMDASNFSITPINSGLYPGRNIYGKYFEWNITLPANSKAKVSYLATPTTGNAHTEDTHGSS